MLVYGFSIETQTTEQIGMKFGTEVVLGGGFDPVHPPGKRVHKGLWGASGASAVHFGENFIKQKLKGTPDLVWVGRLF